MASPVYSTRFALHVSAAAGDLESIYTAPPGHVAVVKCTTSYIGAGAGTNVTWLFASFPFDLVELPGVGAVIRTGLQIVLNPGEQLQIVAAAAGIAVSAHGYLLTL